MLASRATFGAGEGDDVFAFPEINSRGILLIGVYRGKVEFVGLKERVHEIGQ